MAIGTDKSLDINTLKGALGADDFGLLGNVNGEINSLADLEQAATPPTPPETPPTPAAATAPTLVEGIEEIEGDVPSDDTDDQSTAPTATTAPATPAAPQAAKPDLLKVFSENLAENGILSFKNEDYDKAEDKEAFLYEKAQETIEAKATERFNEKYSELPPEIDRLLELHKEGVPLYKVLESDERIASLESIKTSEIEAAPDLQKDIIRELLAQQGYAQDKVEAKIKRYEDLGTLKDEALEGFDTLLVHEKKEQAATIAAEKAQYAAEVAKKQDRLKEIETEINSKDEIIPGFKVTPEEKKLLIAGITKAVAKDKQGRPINALAKARLDDPAMDLKVAYFTLVLKGDLSKLQKSVATKTVKSLKSVIDSQEPITGASQRADATTNAVRPDRDIIKNSLKALRKNF